MKRLATLVISVLLVLSVAPTASAGTLSVETGVTIYEDGNFTGDRLTVISTSPTAVRISDLSKVTTGLHNGCNAPLTKGNWSDCASSFSYSGLPAGYRVVLYSHINYDYRLACLDANGSGRATLGIFPFDLANDNTTSFRVEGGNC